MLFFVQAMTLGVNPLYFMFPTAIATSFAFMLPVATPPNAVVFSYGYVKVADMVFTIYFLHNKPQTKNKFTTSVN